MSPRLDASAIFAIFNCLRIRVSPQCGTLLELPRESRRLEPSQKYYPLQRKMVDKVGVEPTSRGGLCPAFPNATYPYRPALSLTGAAHFLPDASGRPFALCLRFPNPYIAPALSDLNGYYYELKSQTL